MDLMPLALKELRAPAAILDKEARVLDCNDSFRQIFFAGSEQAGTPWLPSFLSPASLEIALAAFSTPDRGEAIDVELRNNSRWVRLYSTSVPSTESCGPILVFASEITDLRPDRIMELHTLEREFFTNEQALFEEIRSIFDWRKEIKQRIYVSIMQQGLMHFSHSLFQGNSLGGLMSLLSMILDGGVQAAQTQEYAPLLREYYANALNTIDTLRRVSDLFGTRGSFRSLPAFELVHLLDTIREEMQERARIKIQRILLSESMPPPDRTLRIDPALFSDAMKEILTNAMKYGPPHGHILVLLFFSDDEFILKVVNPVEPEHRLKEDEFERVFDPFYRHAKVIDERFADEPFGYGLGLTAVRQIMDLHQASVFLVELRQSGLSKVEEEVCTTVSMRYEETEKNSSPGQPDSAGLPAL